MVNPVTHEDVARMFPDLEDHTILELLAQRPSTADLEAVWQTLQGDDEFLIQARQRHGGQINQLIDIVHRAGVDAEDDG